LIATKIESRGIAMNIYMVGILALGAAAVVAYQLFGCATCY